MVRDWLAAHRQRVVLVSLPAAIILTIAWFLLPLLIGIAGLLGGWTFFVAVVLWDRWERVEKYGGRLIGAASYLTGRGKRVGLSVEMQGLINGARKDLQNELPDVMPLPARVRFVRDDADLAALNEGEVVISLKDPRRHAENTARATMAYVSTAALRPARPYVGRLVMTSIDFSLTKKFLKRADVRALDYFLTDIWAPSIEGQPDLQTISDQVERIEVRGVLTRILLTEFLELGRRMWGQNPSMAVQSEAREFVRYVAGTVDRQAGENIPLAFRRAHLRVGTILVGDRERAEAEGARPYIAAVLWSMRQGCTSVYLLGRGARCALVREVAANIENDARVLAVDTAEYVVAMHSEPVRAICVHLTIEPTPRGGRVRRRNRPNRAGAVAQAPGR